MTGIVRIAKERQEQIEVHGYDPRNDNHDKLQDAAEAILCRDRRLWPWSNIGRYDRVMKKSRSEQLVYVGALCAAAVDAFDPTHE